MLSYLHGVRPGNRRTSTISASHSPQNALPSLQQEPRAGAASSALVAPADQTQQVSGTEARPVSSTPPFLPPIPLVSSQRRTNNGQSELDKKGKDTLALEDRGEPRSSAMETVSYDKNPARNGKVSMEDSKRLQLQALGSNGETAPTPSVPDTPKPSVRPKRPIDIAFENMRSYTEPPFRQSVMMPTYPTQAPAQLYQYPPPARPPPMPPPKSLQKSAKAATRSAELSPPNRPPPPPPLSSSHTNQQTQPTSSSDSQSQGHKQKLSLVPPGMQDSTVPAQKHGKGRLNLRNPLSLLARRRSSQALSEALTPAPTAPAVPLPEDFDPRIRGKRVHDFSIPRLLRPHTAGGSSVSRNLQEEGESSGLAIAPPLPGSSVVLNTTRPSSSDWDHAPIFKEHFDDGAGVETDGPAMKKSEAFMNSISQQQLQTEPDPSTLPAFARNLPSSIANAVDEPRKSATSSLKGSLEAVPESPNLQKSGLPSPPHSPPSTASRPSSINDQSLQGIGSPRRFNSKASRFSFDLAGVGSAAQEKLLEDKHRQKEMLKERQNVVSTNDDTDEESIYQDLDDMDDPGYEEQIPGINASGEEDENALAPVAQLTLDNAQFISPNKSSFESITGSTGLTSPGTPRDFGGNLASATSKIDQSPVLPQPSVLSESQVNDHSARPRSTPGDKSSPDVQAPTLQRVISSDSNLAGLPKRQTYLDDELYYDDGMIEDVDDDGSSQDFDESVFDDNSHGLYGLPLRDRSLKPLDNAEEVVDTNVISDPAASQAVEPALHETQGSSPSLNQSVNSDSLAAEQRDALTDLNQLSRPRSSHAAGLTQDNLAKYIGNDLALGVARANQSGAFDRRYSTSTYSEPELVAEDMTNHERSSQLMFDMSGFQEDDADADDDIVAEANREALENDDDGFYGQEFGFYARASGSGEAQYVNGGYFGVVPEGVHRSHSGREGFQEPSLTPITERSEWSNRNSTISLAMHGYPLSTSNYSSELQLSNMMSLPEDGMTLEALMKLRRSAWGGSNASLHSSSNSQHSGSPMTYMAPGVTMGPPSFQQQPNHSSANGSRANINATNSNPNLANLYHSGGFASSNGSDNSLPLDSPTITLSSPPLLPHAVAISASAPPPIKQAFPPPPSNPPPPPPPPPPSHSTVPASTSLPASDARPRPQSGGSTGQRKSWTAPGGNSRNSGGGGIGAESVSYMEEGGVWVLEKRRTCDDGGFEVVGRTVVEGGRI